MTELQTVDARTLIVTGACHGTCLVGADTSTGGRCGCRCGGRYHGVLSGTEVPMPPWWTLAGGLAWKPEGDQTTRKCFQCEPGEEHVEYTSHVWHESCRPIPHKPWIEVALWHYWGRGPEHYVVDWRWAVTSEPHWRTAQLAEMVGALGATIAADHSRPWTWRDDAGACCIEQHGHLKLSAGVDQVEAEAIAAAVAAIIRSPHRCSGILAAIDNEKGTTA